MNKKILFLLLLTTPSFLFSQSQIPYLKKQGYTTQLIVENKPFIILGGELGNSSASSLDYMEPIWPKLKAMNLNTVLAPVYWEQIEKVEGKFDFSVLDGLILKARENKLKLVLLWFGAWKNSMSCYVPGWVKKDQKRFPRVKDEKGQSHEILTAFSDNNLQADIKAFEALMQHIKEFDGKQHTVIMVQVENEVGMLPSARDHHPAANKLFEGEVPGELIQYLTKNKSNLVPEFVEVWKKNGFKTSGNWEAIFGKGLHTDELFMAWNYANYVNKVTEAGKAIYSLPMFVNAALNRPGREPGKGYPSAGPLPHVMDLWRAGAPAIDFFAPDFYNPRFKHWNNLYTRQGNPLFIPEHRFDKTAAAKAIYAIGNYEGMGFSPFSIESTDEPENEPLGKAYDLLSQLAPTISKQQGQMKIKAVLFDKSSSDTIIQLGDYEFTCKHDFTLGWSPYSKDDTWPMSGAVIIQMSDDEFYIAGTGVVLTFNSLKKNHPKVGILNAAEGEFINGEWKPGRWLSGDQTHQGRHIRIPEGRFTIQRFGLYTYQ